ncbi:MAG TPA: hypothetical protein VLJ41_05620 [Segetibacter sp.]|nr:hypothetical protein [Segetibacter sp.]
METQPFLIKFLYKKSPEIAEVKPCCQEDNIFYYDVYMHNEYQFTVTPSWDEEKGIAWKISLKNADKKIEKEMIDAIGQEIEKHLL